MIQHKPGLIQADYVINEGGGMPLRVVGKLFYTIENVEKENVIPDRCELVLDCRLVPGFAKEAVLDRFKGFAAELGLPEHELEIEFIQDRSASESPIETDLYRSAERAFRTEHPEAEIVPYLLGGPIRASSARWGR